MSTALVLAADERRWNWLMTVDFLWRLRGRPLPAPQGPYSCLEYSRKYRGYIYAMWSQVQ